MMYKTVCMVYNAEGEIWYKFIDDNLEPTLVPSKDIKKFLSTHETDLSISETEATIKLNGETVSKVPIYEMPVEKKEIDGIEVFYGNSLKKQLKSMEFKRVRSEITVVDYLKGNVDKALSVCTVCGVRFTGKRDLVKHDLVLSGMKDNTIWLRVNKEIKHINLKIILDLCMDEIDTKLIVIENSEHVSDLHRANWLLNMADKGIKVVLITPGDIMLKQSSKSVFFCRIHSIYTTAITYADFKTLNSRKTSFLDYCRSLTVVNTGVYNDVMGVGNVDITIPSGYNVLDDLYSTIAPNEEALKYFSNYIRENNPKSFIMAELLRILSWVVINGAEKYHQDGITLSHGFATWMEPHAVKLVGSELIKKASNKLGVPIKNNGDALTCGLVYSALQDMKILFHVCNCAASFSEETLGIDRSTHTGSFEDVKQCSMYLTNPMLVNRLRALEMQSVNCGYLPRRRKFNGDIFGRVFESAVMYNAYTILRQNGTNYKVNYYRDAIGRELDLVIYKRNSNRYADENNDKGNIILCEVKSCFDSESLLAKQFKWLCNEFTERLINDGFNLESDKAARLVVYSGEDITEAMQLDDKSNISASVIGAESFIRFLNSI